MIAMKPITRKIHTLRKALGKLKTALRMKAKDKDSPAWDPVIAHYREVAMTFAKTETERKLIASL